MWEAWMDEGMLDSAIVASVTHGLTRGRLLRAVTKAEARKFRLRTGSKTCIGHAQDHH